MNPRKQRVWAVIAVAAAAGMLGLSFAAVPLYGAFCRVTGFGGTTQTADAAPKQVLDRAMEIRFDTNVAAPLPITFTADKHTMNVRLGETALAFFRVSNPTDKPVPVVATYNVTPYKTGLYFQKLECFCFQEQTIAPGQSVELPVVFFVDPRLDKDPDAVEVAQITLSYTFFSPADAGTKTAEAGGLAAGPGRDVATQ